MLTVFPLICHATYCSFSRIWLLQIKVFGILWYIIVVLKDIEYDLIVMKREQCFAVVT